MLATSLESFAGFLRDNAMSVAARALRKTCCVLGSIMAAARPYSVCFCVLSCLRWVCGS